MTITETNPRVDRSTALEILDDLDFDPELPCEMTSAHSAGRWGHEGPGEIYVRVISP